MSTIPSDPIIEMFSQSYQFKNVCFDLLNQHSSMDDFKSEFLEFYEKSLDQLDKFFSSGLNIKGDKTPSTILSQPSILNIIVNKKDQEILVEAASSKPNTKRKKLDKNEYIEKVLLDFGYQDDVNTSKMTLESKTKSVQLTDDRILIKLNDPKAPLERNFGPTYDIIRPTSAKKPQNLSKQSTFQDLYPTISITGSEENSENKENINCSNAKSNFTFRNSGLESATKDNKAVVHLDFFGHNMPIKSLLKPVVQKSAQKSETKSISDLKSPFGQMNLANNNNPQKSKSKSKKKSNFRKSLLEDFEIASRRQTEFGEDDDEIKLPSEDKNCNRELEDLISSISQFHKESKAKKLAAMNKEIDSSANTSNIHNVSTKNTSTEFPSSLSNQVHNILYSKHANFVDSDDEAKDDEDDSDKKSESSEGTSFHSFSNGREPEDDMFRDEEYDLTDYSDNSSSNVGTYSFHEEDEELPEPPKMFQLFNTFQLNIKDPCSQCNNVPEPSQGLSQGNLNANLFKGESQNLFDRVSGESNNSQTLFHDFQYYLKVQGQQQKPNFGANAEDEREFRLSKLNNSPLKQSCKVKRVYCGDKKVPLWASNLKECEKVSKEQKKVFNPLQIFGHFNVDNLNLVEVFISLEPRMFSYLSLKFDNIVL